MLKNSLARFHKKSKKVGHKEKHLKDIKIPLNEKKKEVVKMVGNNINIF